MNNPLPTGKQIEYMNFIDKFIEEQDNFPSITIIGEHFGVNPNCAMDHLKALKKKGYVEMCEKMQKYRRTSGFKSFMSIRQARAA
tara:strand:- start:231 stop:485 length:255 start_codon:yes stop_codon:yes gene_type:complete